MIETTDLSPDELFAYLEKDDIKFLPDEIEKAKRGDPQGYYDIGYKYQNTINRQYETGLAWFRLAAVKGHSRAMLMIGDLYNNGKIGNTRKQQLAMQWYMQAVKLRDPWAYLWVSRSFQKGDGVPADAEKEAEWKYNYYKERLARNTKAHHIGQADKDEFYELCQKLTEGQKAKSIDQLTQETELMMEFDDTKNEEPEYDEMLVALLEKNNGLSQELSESERKRKTLQDEMEQAQKRIKLLEDEKNAHIQMTQSLNTETDMLQKAKQGCKRTVKQEDNIVDTTVNDILQEIYVLKKENCDLKSKMESLEKRYDKFEMIIHYLYKKEQTEKQRAEEDKARVERFQDLFNNSSDVKDKSSY